MIYFLYKIVEFGLVKLYNFYINHFRKEKRRNYEEIKKSYEPFIGMRYGFVRTYCPTCAASTSRRDCAGVYDLPDTAVCCLWGGGGVPLHCQVR